MELYMSSFISSTEWLIYCLEEEHYEIAKTIFSINQYREEEFVNKIQKRIINRQQKELLPRFVYLLTIIQ